MNIRVFILLGLSMGMLSSCHAAMKYNPCVEKCFSSYDRCIYEATSGEKIEQCKDTVEPCRKSCQTK